jgi:hypothetical protein
MPSRNTGTVTEGPSLLLPPFLTTVFFAAVFFAGNFLVLLGFNATASLILLGKNCIVGMYRVI